MSARSRSPKTLAPSTSSFVASQREPSKPRAISFLSRTYGFPQPMPSPSAFISCTCRGISQLFIPKQLITPLDSALARSAPSNLFLFRTYKKVGGGGEACGKIRPFPEILNSPAAQTLRSRSMPQFPQSPRPASDPPPPSPTLPSPLRTPSVPAFPSSAAPANQSPGTRTAIQSRGYCADSSAFAAAAAPLPFPSRRNLPGFRSSKSNPRNAARPAPCFRSPAPRPPPARS